MIRALFSKEILLELVLDWQSLEKSEYPSGQNFYQEIEQLHSLLDSGLRIYVPPFLLLHIDHLINYYTDKNQDRVKRCIDDIINNIRCDYIYCDQDSLVESATAIFGQLQPHIKDKKPPSLSDIFILLCTQKMQLNAIVTRYPCHFQNIIEANKSKLTIFKENNSSNQNNDKTQILTPNQFIKYVKTQQSLNDEKADEITVYTPTLREIKLRRNLDNSSSNLTPLDFVFALHGEMGYECSGAKVNGKDVPLNHSLQNEDVVEIKKDGTGPRNEWLKWVGTKKAFTKIKNKLKNQIIELGKEELEKILGRNSYKSKECLDVVRSISRDDYSTIDHFFYALGSNEPKSEKDKKKLKRTINKIKKKLFLKTGSEEANLEWLKDLWQQEKDSSWRLALCCKPLPEDGKSIVAINHVIHFSDCSAIKNSKNNRQISWDWNHCRGTLSIKTCDWPGILQNLLKELAVKKIWVDVRNVSNHANKTSTVHLLIPLVSRQQMKEIENLVKDLPGIIKEEVKWTKITPAKNGWSCNLFEKPSFL